MRNSLMAVLACAYVILASACVTPDEEDESSLEEALKDHEETHCPSGGSSGGGDGHGGPGDKPARKNCADLAMYPDVEGCKQCCFYNNNHVDGWECRRKKTPAARQKCWMEANEKMGKCSRQCEWDRGGIMTINPTFP